VKTGPSAGRLRSDLASLGLAIATRPAVRTKIRSEIRAQFEACRARGFVLDHVNAHRHYHLHPTILSEILAIGADYGARALRTPVESHSDLRRVEPTAGPSIAILTAPWAEASVEGRLDLGGSRFRAGQVRSHDRAADRRLHP
jgi:predicted glycoside hydrolase/deacetylase ChbG (UPF0249 family)